MNSGGGGMKKAALEEAKLGNRMREGHLQKQNRRKGERRWWKDGGEERVLFLFVWFFLLNFLQE